MTDTPLKHELPQKLFQRSKGDWQTAENPPFWRTVLYGLDSVGQTPEAGPRQGSDGTVQRL